MVLVKVDTSDIVKDAGGLIALPKEVEDKHQLGQKTGVVLEVGKLAFTPLPGQPNVEPDFAVGDHVMFKGYAGVEMIEEDDSGKKVTYRYMHDTDVIGVK